jgi:hypothetical protein
VGTSWALATSRVYNYRCNFCSIWRIRKGVVGQFSLDRVIKELKGFEAITDERLKGLNKANKNDFN